jgi:hypothetical protein
MPTTETGTSTTGFRHDPLAAARQFVGMADIPARSRAKDVIEPVSLQLDAAKNQAAVVGSDVMSFVKGVTSDRREAIINSSLLAQLVAAKKFPNFTNTQGWYDAYFDVLTNIGWVLQDKSFAVYEQSDENFETHNAIISVATALLGPASTALGLLVTTLNALEKMNSTTPWITIFSRESQRASTGRFQVSLVEQNEADQFFVSLMAFEMEAKKTITKILFFSAEESEVTLRHSSGKVTINTTVLDGVSAPLKAKLVDHGQNFVRTLPDL